MRWSLNGSSLSSPLMSWRILSLAALAETSSPSSVASPLEKKYLSSKTPRGVCTYLLVVTRLTVDSCMSICRATC